MESRIFIYCLVFFSSLLMSYFLTLVAKRLSFKLKILDYPNEERKIHNQPIALLGGWAIYLSFCFLTLSFIIFFPNLILTYSINLWQVIGIIIAGLILMISGTLDDKYNLNAGQQLILTVLACLVIVFSGTIIKFVSKPGGGIIDLTGLPINFLGQELYLIGAILTFLWLLIITNTTKLLDGLDGLASGITGIGMIILFIVSLFWDAPNSGTSILILILAGSIFGFLILNFHPAKIFLGNGGSTFLGLSLGVMAIISGAKIATALLVMGLPLLDMVWVIIQRLRKGESPFKHADRKHLHFRLLNLGLSKRQTVLSLYLISLFFGFIALFQGTIGKLTSLTILVLFIIIIFSLISLKTKKFDYNKHEDI
jgi:UDP-GlcNAc:undecaprenyl-phosphate/decaprenyl-phosphate GlcNAc-1-phosphate transferase